MAIQLYQSIQRILENKNITFGKVFVIKMASILYVKLIINQSKFESNTFQNQQIVYLIHMNSKMLKYNPYIIQNHFLNFPNLKIIQFKELKQFVSKKYIAFMQTLSFTHDKQLIQMQCFMFQSSNNLMNSFCNIFYQEKFKLNMQSNVRLDNSPLDTSANKNQQQSDSNDKVSLLQLYRFADCHDYLLIALGVVFAMVAGCSFPWFAFLWGKILDSFLYASDADQRLNNAIYYRNIFFYVGLGALFSSWISFGAWTILSERMAVKCRKAYMKSLLRQDVGWFDTQNQFELSSNFNADALAYQRATGEKIGSMFNLMAMFICGAIIALLIRWTMALVILASLPIIGAVIILFIYLIHKKNSIFQSDYEKADACAHQALNSIKTVKALNGQNFQKNKYCNYLSLLKQKIVPWAIYAGIGTGLFFFIQYCAFSFGFWYGTHCVAGTYRCSTQVTGSVYTPGEATIVFFAIFVGSFNFMQLMPNIMAILEGLKAAKRLYKIIDQQPQLYNASKAGKKGLIKEKIDGEIIFDNVVFSYPKEQDRQILRGISLKTEPNGTTAFVGDSGCGKSTIIQLIMRFYDPNSGSITLDGVDLRQYDIEWLRSQIGYVGQEPSLFVGSIKDNVRIGKSNATQEEIRQALRQAQALDFVQKLPNGLDYDVGYSGSKLSGGQKQRIAIARALVRKPSLLILDEATSALDRKNQKLIQQTLDRISRGVTTLTIAHRVKTIMHANKIYVLQSGVVAQSGIFSELKRFQDLEIDVLQQQPANNQLSPRVQKSQTQKQKTAVVEGLNTQNNHQLYNGSVYGRLFSYTQGHRCLFFLGIILCIIAGAAHPGGALLLANILQRQFTIYPYSKVSTSDQIVTNTVSDAQKYVLGLFLLAIFIFVPFMLQSALFTYIGETVTQKLRTEVYQKLLRLPVKWFQKRQNLGGAAATRFGVDSRQVNSLVTSLVSTLVMNFSSIIIGMIFAFIFVWQLGIVGLIAMPCMVAAGFISMLFYGGFGDSNKQYYEQSATISQQAILNIRTVYSCNYQHRLGQIYDQKLQYPLDNAFAKGTKLGLLYGFSQLILQFTFGVLFYFGALVMRDNPDVSLINIFYAIMSITWAGWYAGNNFYFMPDIVSGKKSAQNLFMILDEEDEDQLQVKVGSQLLKTPLKGNIQLRNVVFRYGLNEPILNNISLQLNQGQKIAFVGPSGCGKSTLVQLLQRFYEYQGHILIDGIQIRDYDIHYLRSCIAAVNQEPSLFTGTIKDNIKYNKQVSDEQIADAATNAQSMNFIGQNEKGLDRDVGVLGSQLSGGQKQRLAIARAIIRKPQILMLDEATSALDRTTEKKVQENIDNLMNGKTSLVVAHRIETIMNSNRIYLFDKGEIIEEGSYKELMGRKRQFYNLQRGAQMTE